MDPHDFANVMEPDFDLRLLHHFLAVAGAGTFTGTSERLRITHPARAVASDPCALERAVGTPLSNRGPHGVELTPARRLLSQDAHTLVDLADTAPTRLLRLGRNRGSLGLRLPSDYKRLFERYGMIGINGISIMHPRRPVLHTTPF
ncbi:unnamed protein product [[Actinomadura] parvosata subsp. kistnae]|uniref:HTH lysR-type domain-containing protein n=1 Tax=[Actinomadura] parvosata subsp. kistnae TaxID=1909395 RepID=A0A1V0AE98_9ACTN|nr:LysR family transcriptional regulator [Nonomuraea sp. ATCC 55076]AQZ68554.1 hypothetical protein BKM31_50110 [Nonomuraea sp. ATCC 55076]SPL92981.1 unnamed protein product [Actinomadura parvosata subsp. kistnae]